MMLMILFRERLGGVFSSAPEVISIVADVVSNFLFLFLPNVRKAFTYIFFLVVTTRRIFSNT